MISLIISLTSRAQITYSGQFCGNNLYFQNPKQYKGQEYCTDSLYLNGKRIDVFLNTGAFEIDLKSMGFSIGDSLKILVFHKYDCKPFLLHQSFYIPRESDTFSIVINDNLLKLISIPKNTNTFNVEVYKWNKWVCIGQIDTLDSFSLNDKAHSGLNVIRVVSIDFNGLKKSSNEVNYSGVKSKVAFDYLHEKKVLTFSRLTAFELYNFHGEIILKGESDFIDLSGYSKGRYYLNFDNENAKIKIR